MSKSLIFVVLIGLALIFISSALSDSDQMPYERVIEQAKIRYERSVRDANTALAAAKEHHARILTNAKKELIASYDQAITIAIRRGGGDGLDAANRLNKEKKEIESSQIVEVEVAVEKKPKEEEDNEKMELAKQLIGKKWYFHWENPRKKKGPYQYFPSGTIVFEEGTRHTWKIKDMLVIEQGGNYLIPIKEGDKIRLRGFFASTGRQVGAFSE